MTFSEVYDEYERQEARATKEWAEYRATRAYNEGKKYIGFSIDYELIDMMLIEAAQDEFHFTPKEAGFIHGEAYERYHSSYTDMPFGMKRLCDFIKQFKALDK